MKIWDKFFFGLVILWVACTLGQDFIKVAKPKKVYVSCQQYIELEGELVSLTNGFWGVCADLLKIAFLMQKSSLDTINAHVGGEKETFLQQADKHQRTDKYEKLMKIKCEFERCIAELSTMKQRLEDAIAVFYA